jgi:hypothetical protein
MMISLIKLKKENRNPAQTMFVTPRECKFSGIKKKSNRRRMKNLGDVVGEMKIAYVNGCISFGMQFQNWMNFLLLESQDSKRTSMMDVKRILGPVSRVVRVMFIFKCF